MNNNAVQTGNVSAHNASSDRLASAFTLATSPFLLTDIAPSEKQSDSTIGEHPLFHWKSLLVLSTLKNVVAQRQQLAGYFAAQLETVSIIWFQSIKSTHTHTQASTQEREHPHLVGVPHQAF